MTALLSPFPVDEEPEDTGDAGQPPLPAGLNRINFIFASPIVGSAKLPPRRYTQLRLSSGFRPMAVLVPVTAPLSTSRCEMIGRDNWKPSSDSKGHGFHDPLEYFFNDASRWKDLVATVALPYGRDFRAEEAEIRRTSTDTEQAGRRVRLLYHPTERTVIGYASQGGRA